MGTGGRCYRLEVDPSYVDIFTTKPNELCARPHNRIARGSRARAWPTWLGEEPAGEAQLKSLLGPTPQMKWFAGR